MNCERCGTEVKGDQCVACGMPIDVVLANLKKENMYLEYIQVLEGAFVEAKWQIENAYGGKMPETWKWHVENVASAKAEFGHICHVFGRGIFKPRTKHSENDAG